MYRLLFFILMATVVSNVFGSGVDDFDSKLFARYNGNDQFLAKTITRTAETGALPELQKVLNSVPEEKSDEILIALLNHPADAVIVKVADVLATRKKRVVAEALCSKLQRSNSPIFGGTEQATDRAAAIQQVERSLQRILGRAISPDVPLHDRVTQYSQAIATLK